MKVCGKCKIEKELTEFYKDKNKKDGLSGWCKQCNKKYKEQYYQDNKEEIVERHKQYRQDNKEEIAEYHKQYYQDNKEEIVEHRKQYYQDNKEEIAEYHKQYRQDNKEAVNAHQKANRLISSPKGLERHHWDYSKPLDIILLTRLQHRRLHALMYKDGNQYRSKQTNNVLGRQAQIELIKSFDKTFEEMIFSNISETLFNNNQE